MSNRMCCPDCGDLMCFHNGTVCPMKTHSDVFENLKEENVKLKECLLQMQNAAIDLVAKLEKAQDAIRIMLNKGLTHYEDCDFEYDNDHLCDCGIDEIEKIARESLP